VRRDHQEIKRVLLQEWDPIGVGDVPEAQDEYDGYVPDVHRLLMRRASLLEVFDYLWQLETEHMGLRGNRAHTQEIADVLVALAERLEA
jgi:hypothetical protein